MSLTLVALIFLLSSSLSDAVSVIYKRSGDEVVIPTGSEDVRITVITWKHNEDIAVEWYGEEPSAYRHFNGSTTLDTLTGDLTISGLTREHSGSYTAEINNKVAGKTEVRVISPVPKPTVSKRCDDKMTSCTLTCEGNTMDAEPLTYSWQTSDENSYYEIQQVTVTEEDSDCWFHCEMKNPISAETSEEFSNPFSSIIECKRTIIIIIIVVFILILLLMVLVYGILKYRKWKSKKEMKRLLEVLRNRLDVPIEETLNQTSHVSSVVLDSSSQTEESEESNGDETPGPLLEERNQSISVSAT